MIWNARGIHTRYDTRAASTSYEVPRVCIAHDIIHHIMNSTDIRYEQEVTPLSGNIRTLYIDISDRTVATFLDSGTFLGF